MTEPREQPPRESDVDGDFAGEHQSATFADDTEAPEGPDESVPDNLGGMDRE